MQIRILPFIMIVLTVSCGNGADAVAGLFTQKQSKEALIESNKPVLFDVFEDPALSPEKRKALEFLYAYSPFCDLAEYDGDFFLKNVESSFAAREYFTWGKDIPEDIFCHFVLPVRLYHEYLDTSRMVFFEELKGRVSGMSMEDAVWAVNFWILEKAAFQGRSGRPVAPLSTCATAWGSCYELALLGAAALRSVCIPARFCTTTWTTSRVGNHAWIEAWVNGKWITFSAAEPPHHKGEPTWVDDHCQVVALVTSDVFGNYRGPEEVLYGDAYSTRINLIGNYADTKTISVFVKDKRGRQVSGAHVKLKLFSGNTIVTVFEYFTDAKGEMSLTTSKNGYIVEAAKNGMTGHTVVDSNMTEVNVILDDSGNISSGNLSLDVIEMFPVSECAPDDSSFVIELMAKSETVRRSYMESFATEKQAYRLADSLSIERNGVWQYLKASNGNWKEIAMFIEDNHLNSYMFPILSAISENDLKEVSAACLSDHLDNFTVREEIPDNLIVPYILAPSIENVFINTWRSVLALSGQGKSAKQITKEIRKSVKIVSRPITSLYTVTTPVGVESLKIADTYSRNIYFIACCRAAGIPARMGTYLRPQYYENGKWQYARL